MNNIGKDTFDLGFMDTLAEGDSALHRIDPKAKIITTVIFLIAVTSFDKYTLSALIPFFIYPIILIAAGGLTFGYIFKKVLMVSPFAVMVGIFNPLIDRTTFLNMGAIGISGGMVSFLSIILRFMLTVTTALAIVALTGINSICEAVAQMGVPRPLVTQILLFYRYIFVLSDEAERMARARTVRSFSNDRLSINLYASLAGGLLIRTVERSERVYRAMCCRGFDGTVRGLKKTGFGIKDLYFVLGWTAIFMIFRFYNLPLRLGELIMGFLR